MFQRQPQQAARIDGARHDHTPLGDRNEAERREKTRGADGEDGARGLNAARGERGFDKRGAQPRLLARGINRQRPQEQG